MANPTDCPDAEMEDAMLDDARTLPWGGKLVAIHAATRAPMRDGTPRCHPGWKAWAHTEGPDENSVTGKPQTRYWDGPSGFATEAEALAWSPSAPVGLPGPPDRA